MRLPSGTRMCLLLVFGFLLLTTEFPEFQSRLKASSSISRGDGFIGDLVDGEDASELADLSEASADVGTRSSILVEAWGFGGGWGYRRRWGGWGGGYRRGWGGGWGYRRRWGGGGWGYRRRCCWGKRR